jgi:glucan-binding YG repeat protein
MKKRAAALFLSLALAAAMPVSAADFEEQTTEVTIQSEELPQASNGEADLPEATVAPSVTEDDASTAEDQTNDAFDSEIQSPDADSGEIVPTETSVPQEPSEETTAPETDVDEDDFASEVVIGEILEEEESADELAEEIDEDFSGIDLAAVTPGTWVSDGESGTLKYKCIKSVNSTTGEIEYYTSADKLVELNKCYYLFDENGYMLTGKQSYRNRYIFLMDESTAILNKGVSSKAVKTPQNSNLGQQQKSYWRWTGKAFEYYNGSGNFMTVQELRTANLAKGTYRGYYKINGSYYALKDNGVPRTGDYEITEGIRTGLYYFYPEKNADGYPGAMAVATWVHIKNDKGDRWRYYDRSGRTTLGIKAAVLDKKLDASVGSRTYLLSNGGYIYTQKVMRKAANGYYYICNSSGVVYKNKLITYNGARYYVTSSGKRATYTNCWKWLSCANNRPYYFGKTPGKVTEKTGWVKITASNGTYAWYYFSKNGNAAINGWVNDYYFSAKGALASGLKTIDGKMYYFRESNATTHRGKVYKNTVITNASTGKKYYAGSNGVLYQSKWAYINGGYYYFQKDGTLLTDSYQSRNGVYGYVDANGKYTTGWVVVSASTNKVRYINPDAPGYVRNTYKIIDGVRYYFDSDGYRVSDLTSYYPSNWQSDPVLVNIHNGSYTYYLECDKANGVITIYTGTDKSIPVRSVRTSVGNPTSLTTSGTYALKASLRWQPLMGPSWGQYGTHVVGAGQGGIYIHSVAGSAANLYSLPAAAYDKLGTPASHGCLRVCVKDAKWIYENCSGGTIKIFYGTYQAQECDKGPLGRDPLVARYGSGNFDPTDPAV